MDGHKIGCASGEFNSSGVRYRCDCGYIFEHPEDEFELRPVDSPPLASMVPAKYPELDQIADELCQLVVFAINTRTLNVTSAMPYKNQYVLEELIQKLQAKV